MRRPVAPRKKKILHSSHFLCFLDRSGFFTSGAVVCLLEYQKLK